MSKLKVDGATGSAELIAPLQKMGLPAEKDHLPYGDLAFMGRGEEGTPLFIGIEFKKLGELVGSLRTGRFQGHQLIGMVNPESGFDRRYLLVEGFFHHDERGAAIVPRGRGVGELKGAPNAVALEQELLNICTRGGVTLVDRATRRDCLRWILACYRYWTDKDLDEHKSHLAMYAPDIDKALFTPPTDFRKALAVTLPGIEFAVSKAVEDYCGGPEVGLRQKLLRMCAMTERQWGEITTVKKGKARQLGAKRAHSIMEALK